VADLHAAYANAAIDGIVCTRAGGFAELLPHLDAELVRANPKVFVDTAITPRCMCGWLARRGW